MIKKKKFNIWKRLTIILSIFFIVSVGYSVVTYKNYDSGPFVNEDNINKRMCSSISVTPSWMSDMKLVGTGIQPFGNTSDIIIDALIQQKIYFLYNPNCGACAKQIEFFGDDWERYNESKFAIDCSKIN